MILVDANLLIYSVDASSPRHAAAKAWLEETLSGNTPVGLPWTVILAFLRITTRPGIFASPLTPEQAMDYVDGWLQQPYVKAVSSGDGHWPVLRNLLRTTGTAGNLTSDAHIAALALEHGYAVYSTDNDFRRFPGIEHVNPLAG